MTDDTPLDPSRDVLDEVQDAIDRLRAHPDPEVRTRTDALLAGIDAVHRTALTHLVAALQSMGGESLMSRLVADPAIRLLLMSYDLIAVDRRLMAEEALDAVRGHLHGYGVDVELVDVLGGVVYVQFHADEAATYDEAAVRRDVEAALQAGLTGFQQLEVGARRPTTSGGQVFVSLDDLRRRSRTVPEFAVADVRVGDRQLVGMTVGDEPVLLTRVDGALLAVRNRCGDSPLPLHFGTIDDVVLTCSWHGCRYDLRTGERLDQRAPGLPVHQARDEGTGVRVVLTGLAGPAG
jgi:nitrite reductase/ring-hydroxylating ferredoxin subunit